MGVPLASFNQTYEYLVLLETDVVSDFMADLAADLATSALNGLSNISLIGETLNPKTCIYESFIIIIIIIIINHHHPR